MAPNRQPPSEATIDWKLSVPVRLATMVEQLLWNDTLRRPEYGARSHYVTELIEADLQRRGLFTLADVIAYRKEEPSS